MTFEDDQNHLYFNPILTDDFLFKKAILKKFEEIKTHIEKNYGIQENHGVFNSFYILFTKKYYKNTFISIFFILTANLIMLNVHHIYSELNLHKSKSSMTQPIQVPNYINMDFYGLNNKNIAIYFFSLFLSFNFLNIILHVILNLALNYNSIFSYDSIKNLEKHLESEEKALNENQNGILDNYDNNENSIFLDDFLKKISKTIKKKLKEEIIFTSKIKRIIHTFCLVVILVCVSLFLILKHQNIYILFVFDLCLIYYSGLIYLHFSEKSKTLLRNCTTSIMYVTICFITITHNFVILNLSLVLMLSICIFLIVILILSDWILIDHSIAFKGMQKVEFSLMKKTKK